MTFLPYGRLEFHLHEEQSRLLSLGHFHLGHTDSGLLTDTEFAVAMCLSLSPLCTVFVSCRRDRGLGSGFADSPGRRQGLGGMVEGSVWAGEGVPK